MSTIAPRAPGVDTTLGARRDARRDRQIAALSPAERRLFDIVVDDVGPDEAMKLAQALIDALNRKIEARRSSPPTPPMATALSRFEWPSERRDESQ